MKRALAVLGVLGVLGACKAGDGDDSGWPVQPGGGQVMSLPPGATDAGTGDGGSSDGGTLLTSRVCVLRDLTRVGDATACAAAIAGTVTVTLGGQSAITAADGTFSILAADGSDAWRISGTNLTAAVIPYTGAIALLPTMRVDDYNALRGDNQSPAGTPLQGSLVVRVLSSNAPVAGVTATSVPVTTRLALYDTTNPDAWNDTGGTGARGVVWFPDIPLNNTPPTTATVTLHAPAIAAAVQVSAPIEDQAITFVSRNVQ